MAIVDVFWGLAIAGAGVTWLLLQADAGPRGALAVLLAVLWAARLALHILWRSRGKPEDRRYRVIRARNEPNFAFKSLYLVFLLQAVLAWLVAMPLLGAALSGDAPAGCRRSHRRAAVARGLRAPGHRRLAAGPLPAAAGCGPGRDEPGRVALQPASELLRRVPDVVGHLGSSPPRAAPGGRSSGHCC